MVRTGERHETTDSSRTTYGITERKARRPVTLVAYTYGPGMTGVIAQVNGHWLVRGGRLLPCDVAVANNPADAVATVQLPLLYTMAADARAV